MAASLSAFLERQKQILDELNKLLKDEFAVLKNRQAFSLPKINQRKQALLSELTANDRAIGQLPDRDDLKTVYKTQMEEIQKQLQICQKQNAVNGRLIQLSITSNRRLGMTLSKLKDRNSMTYDDKGATHSSASSGMNIEC
ncbi:MAG: flagellar protein FlgN [Succinivibrionaceae bacterium]|nr:flagellar protein FlgN [Succinivibrionaceae bacterium]